MEHAGLVPGLLTFNSVINACAKAGDVCRAEHWLSEMSERGVKPDTVSYSTVIHACLRAHDPHRAEHWLTNMQAAGEPPSNFCFNSVIQAFALQAGHGQARCPHIARAEHWLKQALWAQAKVG